MKIKFNSNNNLPLNEILKVYNSTVLCFSRRQQVLFTNVLDELFNEI